MPRLCRLARRWGLGGVEFLAGIPGTLGGALVMNSGTKDRSLAEVVTEVEVMDTEGKRRTREAAQAGFGYRTSSLGNLPVLGARLALADSTPEKVARKEQEYLSRRWSSQPKGVRCAGCVFRNPPGSSAGELLDRAGAKGMRYGDAVVSSVHANFVVNEGRATAAEVRTLVEQMRDLVQRRFGITLEPEVRIVGTRDGIHCSSPVAR